MEDRLIIKGSKEGLNAVVNLNSFKSFEEVLEMFREKLSRGKKFYKGCTLKISLDTKKLSEEHKSALSQLLSDEFLVSDCTFEDINLKAPKMFTGVYEGKTKFIRKTVRGGQCIDYPGNIVIVGDVNPGAEVHAGGNIIVLGNLRGNVYAGEGGNDKAIIAAFRLQPEILKIANLVTRSPEEEVKPKFPEVARIKEDYIIVEPYLPNKFI